MREFARQAVHGLIDINLTTGDGDLFIGTDDYDDQQMEWFTAEVRRCMARLWPAARHIARSTLEEVS